MEYTVLGKTGLKISRMGFGGIPIQKTDAGRTKELIRYLAEQGVNYIDTARGYTVSESYLGYALEGIRDRFVVATKSMARTKEAMAKDIDISLQNLRTDYIDIYQVHNPSAQDLQTVLGPDGALIALQEAKQAGKIGHIGITLHSLELFEQAIGYDWVETVMFPYNVVETQAEDLIAACAERKIGFIAMKPLAGGAIEDGRLALRFVMQNPHVSVVIPGMAEIREAEENLSACADPSPLSEEEKTAMALVRKALGEQFCRRCNYCAPCAVGIPIPAVFMMEGYHSRYDLKDWAQARYAGFAHKASECIGCGECEARCPYNLPIRKLMKNAARVLEE